MCVGDHYMDSVGENLRKAKENIEKLNDLVKNSEPGRVIWKEKVKQASAASPQVIIFDVETPVTGDHTFTIDKRVYRIEFINETEDSVDIRITRK